MLKGLIGKKIGMTQIFDEKGVAFPVTIIEAGPCYVTQVRTLEKEGYAAVQLGFGELHPKKLTSGELGHLSLNNLPPMKFLREFRSKESANIGDKVTVDVFTVGERVDVIGTSKGKGFAGAVKRYHFAGGKKTHGQSDRHRAPGSRSSGTTPGRVYKGARGAGPPSGGLPTRRWPATKPRSIHQTAEYLPNGGIFTKQRNICSDLVNIQRFGEYPAT